MQDVEVYFKRVDQSKIAPWFLAKCKLLVANCLARGVAYYAISGDRDLVEQEALYAIGRTTELSRKPVTNARPGASYHHYFAMDFCKDADATRPGLQPDWDLEDYKVLNEEAHKIGLITGLDFQSFKEGPHVQPPFRAGATGDLKKLYLEKGREAVWEFGLNNLKNSIEYKKHYT